MVSSLIRQPRGVSTSVGISVRGRILPLGSRVLPTFTISIATPAAQTITTTANASANATLIAVAALPIPLRAGTTVTIGTVAVTLTLDAAVGALSLTVAPISGSITSGATGTYTPTANTSGAGAIFVSPIPTAIDAGEVLTFGANKVTVVEPAPVNSILLFTVPLTTSITGNASTQALLEVVGCTDATPSSSPNTVDSADYSSGAGAEMTVISTNRTLNLAFNRIRGALGAAMLMYVLWDDRYYNREIYMKVIRASGETFEGAAIATSGDGQSAKQSLLTQNCNLQFQGGSFIWTPAAADNLVTLGILT